MCAGWESGAGEIAAVMRLPTSGPSCLGCDFQEQQGKVDGLLQVSGLLCLGIVKVMLWDKGGTLALRKITGHSKARSISRQRDSSLSVFIQVLRALRGLLINT